MGVAVGEEALAVKVAEILLETAQCPGGVPGQIEDVAPDGAGLFAQTVGFGEYIGINQAHKVTEAVIVAVMGCGRQQQDMVSALHQTFGQLVALGLVHIRGAVGTPSRISRAFVGLVQDDHVPALLPHPLAHGVLLGIVQRGDNLVLPLPEVDELLLVVAGVDNLETLTKEAQQLVLPLDG